MRKLILRGYERLRVETSGDKHNKMTATFNFGNKVIKFEEMTEKMFSATILCTIPRTTSQG